METQKREFLEDIPDRLVFKKNNGKQPDMKNFGFNESVIMMLLEELLLDNDEVIVSFQKGKHALRRWRKNGIARYSVIAEGGTIIGMISREN